MTHLLSGALVSGVRQLALFPDEQAALPGGRARSLNDLDDDTRARFARKLAPWPDSEGHRWWLGASGGPGGGHGKFQLRRGDPTQTVLAHRLAWHLQHGPLDPALILRHTCDVRLCTNPQHLVPGSVADNVHDMLSRGRHHNGSPRWQPHRDSRSPAHLSHDVRTAVRHALATSGANPDSIAAAARTALTTGRSALQDALPLLPADVEPHVRLFEVAPPATAAT